MAKKKSKKTVKQSGQNKVKDEEEVVTSAAETSDEETNVEVEETEVEVEEDSPEEPDEDDTEDDDDLDEEDSEDEDSEDESDDEDEDDEDESEDEDEDDGDDDDEDDEDEEEDEKPSKQFKKHHVDIDDDEEEAGVFAGFFKKKGDPTENILTIFKRPQIYGALIGEVVGTMLLSALMIGLGFSNMLFFALCMLAVTLAIYGLSGANLNPIVTVGMMATRRISAIRGVVYLLAQVLGAWLGLMIMTGFQQSSGTSMEMPAMAAIEPDTFWQVAMIEFVAAIVFAFFFARATAYKKQALPFAVIVSMGMLVAIVVAAVASQYFDFTSNFMINPAISLMYDILPSSGENFGEILGGIMQALSAYVFLPMIGGVIGFYVSDASALLSGEKVKDECHCGHAHGKHHHHQA